MGNSWSKITHWIHKQFILKWRDIYRTVPVTMLLGIKYDKRTLAQRWIFWQSKKISKWAVSLAQNLALYWKFIILILLIPYLFFYLRDRSWKERGIQRGREKYLQHCFATWEAFPLQVLTWALESHSLCIICIFFNKLYWEVFCALQYSLYHIGTTSLISPWLVPRKHNGTPMSFHPDPPPPSLSPLLWYNIPNWV